MPPVSRRRLFTTLATTLAVTVAGFGLSLSVPLAQAAPKAQDPPKAKIVAGECQFGFVLPSGPQVRLTLHPGDVLRIPAGSEHWFQLTPLHQLKAVRLFSFVDHWVTTPTDRAIAPSLAA
jgi:hypothetical protein